MSEKDDYIQMYQTMHATKNKFPGHSVEPHATDIKILVERTKATSLLDYGCGSGLQYSQTKIHEHWGILPTLYDPGVPKFTNKPNRMWDGVICTDVMEHIPESAVYEILYDIISSASKFVFFNISTRLATAILPNGENAHCTVHEHVWWEEQITKMKNDIGTNIIILLTSKKTKTDTGTRTEI